MKSLSRMVSPSQGSARKTTVATQSAAAANQTQTAAENVVERARQVQASQNADSERQLAAQRRTPRGRRLLMGAGSRLG